MACWINRWVAHPFCASSAPHPRTGFWGCPLGTEKLVDYDGDGVAAQRLHKIEDMRDTLGDHCITPANFPNSAASAPLASLLNLARSDAPGEAKREPLISYNPMWNTVLQRRASHFGGAGIGRIALQPADGVVRRCFGIHNRRFSAHMLYDSIMNLNGNAHAGQRIGAKRP